MPQIRGDHKITFRVSGALVAIHCSAAGTNFHAKSMKPRRQITRLLKSLPFSVATHHTESDDYCHVSTENRVCLSVLRGRESRLRYWIAACAGMTEPQDRGLTNCYRLSHASIPAMEHSPRHPRHPILSDGCRPSRSFL